MIYGEPDVMAQFKALTEEFPSVWESQDFVNISSERWMTVSFCHDWQYKLADIKPKVDSLGHESQQLVDDTFDELQAQEQLVYTQSYTLFSFPVLWSGKQSRNNKKGEL